MSSIGVATSVAGQKATFVAMKPNSDPKGTCQIQHIRMAYPASDCHGLEEDSNPGQQDRHHAGCDAALKDQSTAAAVTVTPGMLIGSA